MGCLVLCTCKMVQGFGRYHLESVGLCFWKDDSSFAGGFRFVPVCTAVVAVAGLYFLHRVKVHSYFMTNNYN